MNRIGAFGIEGDRIEFDKFVLGGGLQGKATGKQGGARQQRGPCQACLYVIGPLGGSVIAAESMAWAGI
ncbi:hypothetical protein [Heliomarina baculiformis]|uniref:hypothetical protein n=1 Tax=Heliomarina baculiformis TaxID=2872036 RepID=UPI001EE23579|nr:hypothetical protein [Heliomarina baculiformis]